MLFHHPGKAQKVITPPPQDPFLHHPPTGLRRGSSSDSLFHFDDLYVQQSARNLELLDHVSPPTTAPASNRRKSSSLAKRLTRLFSQQHEEAQSSLPTLHKSHSQPQFGRQQRLLLHRPLSRPDSGVFHDDWLAWQRQHQPGLDTSADESQRSSCSSAGSSSSNGGNETVRGGAMHHSNSLNDIFGRLEPISRLRRSKSTIYRKSRGEDPPTNANGSGGGDLKQRLLNQTLPKVIQRQISRKKILDSLFEEPGESCASSFDMHMPSSSRPKFVVSDSADDDDDNDHDVWRREDPVITPVHTRVRKNGQVMLSRFQLVRNLLSRPESNNSSECDRATTDSRCSDASGEVWDVNEMFGGCEEENGGGGVALEDAFNRIEVCEDVIEDEDMVDIFNDINTKKSCADTDAADNRNKSGCAENAMRNEGCEQRVIVVFDFDDDDHDEGADTWNRGLSILQVALTSF